MGPAVKPVRPRVVGAIEASRRKWMPVISSVEFRHSARFGARTRRIPCERASGASHRPTDMPGASRSISPCTSAAGDHCPDGLPPGPCISYLDGIAAGPAIMSRFWSSVVHGLTPYVPGEQPKLDGIVKLNTNENPYGPSPRVLAAIASATDHLRLYPDPRASVCARRSRSFSMASTRAA